MSSAVTRDSGVVPVRSGPGGDLRDDQREPGAGRGTAWFGALYGLCTLGLVGHTAYALSSRAWITGALLAWFALSMGAVTALYLLAARGGNPGPWLKGTRAAWLQPLFVPFRAFAWTVLGLARLVKRVPAVSEFDRGLFVGVRLYAHEVSHLDRVGARCVVDLCAEMPTSVRVTRPPFERLELPVLDRCPPTLDELTRAADWVAARRDEGHGVYIHCAFGRGRSALVAAAVLIRIGRAQSAEESLELLRRARPVVKLGDDQQRMLRRYARSLAAQREDTDGRVLAS